MYECCVMQVFGNTMQLSSLGISPLAKLEWFRVAGSFDSPYADMAGV